MKGLESVDAGLGGSTPGGVRPFRLAVLAYHAVPYQVPFYRALHADPRVEETVFLLSRIGVSPHFDPEMRAMIHWDIPLLNGYNYRFLRNVTFNVRKPLVRRINPALLWAVPFGRYDGVLITGYDTVSAYLGLTAAKMSGAKVILRAEADLSNPSDSLLSRLKRRYLARMLSWYDAVMYSCRANYEYFRCYGLPAEKLFPLPSAIDNAWFLRLAEDRDAQRSVLRAHYQIPEDALVILYAGRFTDRKRPRDLVEAFARMHGSLPKAWLVMVGDGPLRSALEAMVEENGLTRVVFAGFKNASEMPSHFMMADVFALPSQYDPTPKALNEAMILGLPSIVSTGVGTAEDLVKHNVNGRVFEAGNVAALARNLEEILRDETLRLRLGHEAVATVRSWSPEAGVDGIVAALTHCCGASGARNVG